MGGPDHVIETRELTKVYGRHATAVDHLNLSVRRGEVYGFLGPNGAGKTTTLRMLLGLVHATSGRASVLGNPPGHPASLVHVGAVVEEPAFYPYLSGRENLRVIARLAGRSDDAIDPTLDVVGLLGRAGDRYKTYSQGMRQRLGVAAALLKDPDLLILDEPTNGLDPAGTADMRALIRRLGSGERTVLLSSHVLAEVEHVCDRVGVISGGVLIAEGAVDELRGRSSLLIRAAPMDVARRSVERLLGPDRVEVSDGALRLEADAADASRINRELVLAGVAVSEIRPLERTLEDVFFGLMGEERGGSDER